MANWRLLTEFTSDAEGGASADPRDPALSSGHSGVLGKDGGDLRFPNNYIHTNRGVVWATYLNYCKVVGKTPSASEFIKMSNALWEDIFRKLFWDRISGDLINSQAIAEILMEAIWHGGATGMVMALQRFLNENGASLVVDGGMGEKTAKALNKYATTKDKEKKIVDLLIAQRFTYLKSLSIWSIYAVGWTRRVNELQQKAYDTIKKGIASNKGKALFGAVFLIGLGSLAYFYWGDVKKFFKDAELI